MQRLVAIGGALLLILAFIVWWRNDDGAAADAPITAPAADTSATTITDQPPLKHGEAAPNEALTSTTVGVADQPQAVIVSESQAAAVTNAHPKCLRKEDTKVDAAFELNASLRNNESSILDKGACYAAVGEIKRARWMFDSTPTQTVAYKPGADVNWHGRSVQETVLHELCSGDQPFDAASKAIVQLYFVTSTETTKILIGPHWVSDGTVQSPLTEEQYAEITSTLAGRRQTVIGPAGNMSAEMFDKRLKQHYYNRIVAENEAQEQRDKELRRTQRGLPADCVE